MPKLFKGEKEKPFAYPTIVEVRRGSYNNKAWIISLILLAIIILVAILIFR